MLTAISSAEHLQSIADMRRRIAELEIDNQELLTSNQLHVNKVWGVIKLFFRNRIKLINLRTVLYCIILHMYCVLGISQ